MRRIRPYLVELAAFVAVLVAAAPAMAASISIENGACTPPSGTSYCYKPPSQTAASGEIVTWTNQSAAPHTITRCTAAACEGVGPGTGTDTWQGSSTVNSGGGSYSHTFTGTGTYNYYCQIHGYAAMHGTITIGTASDPTPTASFTVSSSNPTTGQSVTFDASASSGGGSDAIVSYHWVFGDGATQTTATPTTAHSYAKAGAVTAMLTVEDSDESSLPASKSITVVGSAIDTSPTASFVFSPFGPIAGQTVTFDASATKDPDGDPITSYFWNFGDGSPYATVSTPTVSHTFATAGSFLIGLIATDSHGKQSAPVLGFVRVMSPNPIPAPTIAKLRIADSRLCTKREPRCRRTKTRVTFTLSARASVVVAIDRHHTRVRHQAVRGRAGANHLILSAAGLRPGRYALVLTPTGGRSATRTFRVLGR